MFLFLQLVNQSSLVSNCVQKMIGILKKWAKVNKARASLITIRTGQCKCKFLCLCSCQLTGFTVIITPIKWGRTYWTQLQVWIKEDEFLLMKKLNKVTWFLVFIALCGISIAIWQNYPFRVEEFREEVGSKGVVMTEFGEFSRFSDEYKKAEQSHFDCSAWYIEKILKAPCSILNVLRLL